MAPFNSPSARIARGEKFEEVFGDHYDAVQKIIKFDDAITQQESGALKSVYKPAETAAGVVAKKKKDIPKGQVKSAVAGGKGKEKGAKKK